MWTDSHAHLYECTDEQLKNIAYEAVDAGVTTIVNTAVSIDTARTVMSQCARFPNVLKPAVGVSPFDSANVNHNWDDRLEALINDNPEIIAVGEIGLDCTNPTYPRMDVQMPVFTKQLEIAARNDLTAIIHSRGMEKKTAEICRDTGTLKAVFHCFTGDAGSMEYIIDCGYYISISGIITYKNSHLRDMIRRIPAERLLIETDTPYLSPTPYRGKPNKPSYLIRTAKEIADLLEIGEIELSEILKKNLRSAVTANRKPTHKPASD